MELIAIHRLHGKKDVAPGERFTPAHLGITARDAEELVNRGAARPAEKAPPTGEKHNE